VAVELFGNLSGLGSGIVSGGVIIVVILLVVAVIVGLWFLFRNVRRFSGFKVVIWEVMESGGIRESYDKAGIFLSSKTGNKLFFLKGVGVGLNPDKLSYIQDAKGKKLVYLLRYGFKNFVFINPVVDDVGKVGFKVGEEDVNWAVNSYEANKKRFSQSLLFQLLPFMVLALVCIIILILMISLFKNFSVLGTLADRLGEIAGKVCVGGSGVVGGGGVI
jgi:hypothetical protein